jgi:hypothetical protein
LVFDTGVLLSLALDQAITQTLKNFWVGRPQKLIVPQDVIGELRYAEHPEYMGSIPKGQAGPAIKTATYLAGSSVKLDPEQHALAKSEFHELLADSDNDPKHWGEAAAAQIATEQGGVVVLEDLTARLVLQRHVRCASLWEILYQRLGDGRLTDAGVNAFIHTLRAAGRPNFDGFTAADVRASKCHPALLH